MRFDIISWACISSLRGTFCTQGNLRAVACRHLNNSGGIDGRSLCKSLASTFQWCTTPSRPGCNGGPDHRTPGMHDQCCCTEATARQEEVLGSWRTDRHCSSAGEGGGKNQGSPPPGRWLCPSPPACCGRTRCPHARTSRAAPGGTLHARSQLQAQCLMPKSYFGPPRYNVLVSTEKDKKRGLEGQHQRVMHGQAMKGGFSSSVGCDRCILQSAVGCWAKSALCFTHTIGVLGYTRKSTTWLSCRPTTAIWHTC